MLEECQDTMDNMNQRHYYVQQQISGNTNGAYTGCNLNNVI